MDLYNMTNIFPISLVIWTIFNGKSELLMDLQAKGRADIQTDRQTLFQGRGMHWCEDKLVEKRDRSWSIYTERRGR